MPCDNPSVGFMINESGERSLVFSEPKSGIPYKEVSISCRLCIGCRLEYKSEWSIRMMHEAQMHDFNQFLTLTYDDENLPEDQSIRLEEIQDFMKKLRRKYAPERLRYVFCGEYGEQTSRPHYHGIVFGLEVPDKQAVGRNNAGDVYYESAWLNQIWGKGKVIVGDVTPQSCGYVAGYMLKDTKGNYIKRDTNGEPLPYELLDPETGELVERERPFITRSNRPGIGRPWFDEYWKDVFPHNFVVQQTNGEYVKKQVPRYYFRLLKVLDPEMADQISAENEVTMNDPKYLSEHRQARLEAKAIVREAKMSQKKRGTPKTGEQEMIAVKRHG